MKNKEKVMIDIQIRYYEKYEELINIRSVIHKLENEIMELETLADKHISTKYRLRRHKERLEVYTQVENKLIRETEQINKEHILLKTQKTR